MSKRIIFITTASACIWIILMESFSLSNIIIGIILGMLVSRFMNIFLPGSKERSEEFKHIKFHKLVTYPFWLIGKVYQDAFGLVKMIFFGGKYGIIKEQLKLDNEILRSILSDSITLTPGTICLDQKGEEITLLCMGNENTGGYPDSVGSLRSIERMLQKAESRNL